MTTEQTMNTEVQTVPAWEEKKLLRSGFNKAIGTALLIYVILNIVVSIVQVVMAIPLYVQMFQPGADTQAAIQELTVILTTQIRYLFVPNAVGALAAYLIMCPVGCKMLKFRMRELFSFKGFSGELVGLGVILGIGAQTSFSILAYGTAALLEKFGIHSTTLDTSLDGDPLGMAALVFMTCIVAPLFEEVLFRGIILRAFSRKNTWFGIIASSVAFGLYHGNLQQFIATTAMGFVMALAASKAKSIIPSVIIHFAMNSTVIALQFVSYYVSESLAETLQFIELGIFVPASIAVIIFKRNIFAPDKREEAPAGGEKVSSFKVLLSSWTAWVYLAVMLGTMLLMTMM